MLSDLASLKTAHKLFVGIMVGECESGSHNAMDAPGVTVPQPLLLHNRGVASQWFKVLDGIFGSLRG